MESWAEDELIPNWQLGRTDAFAELVRRWQQPIGRFLYHMTGRTDVAQDLAQDVFLRVFEAREKYKEKGNFKSWLYRIALNVARDAGRRKRLTLFGVNGEFIDSAKSAEMRVEETETVRLVQAALDGLPTKLREVLVLRHYEDMNFEAIARLTGTPASTLKSRFAVALNRLREKLEENGLVADN